MNISQNFVAFSEYMNFKYLLYKKMVSSYDFDFVLGTDFFVYITYASNQSYVLCLVCLAKIKQLW